MRETTETDQPQIQNLQNRSHTHNKNHDGPKGGKQIRAWNPKIRPQTTTKSHLLSRRETRETQSTWQAEILANEALTQQIARNPDPTAKRRRGEEVVEQQKEKYNKRKEGASGAGRSGQTPELHRRNKGSREFVGRLKEILVSVFNF